jgi:hypothetical protein
LKINFIIIEKRYPIEIQVLTQTMQTTHLPDVNDEALCTAQISKNRVDIYDLSIIVIYFICVIATAIYAMCDVKRNTISGYFLAGRYMWWLPVGYLLFIIHY